MENETLTVDGDTQELVALYGLFAQACERMMAALDRFIVAFKNGAEYPPRKEWPDLLLEPDINQISGQLSKEGRLLTRFKAGELPAEAVKAGNRYIQKEDELVEKVEELTLLPCLLDSRRADHALWNYMKRKTDDPVDIQQAKVKDMVAEKLRCYRQNAKELTVYLCKVQSAPSEGKVQEGESKEARRLERIEGKVDAIARPAGRFFWHDWPNKKRVKMRELEAVLAYVQANDDIGPEGLHDACKTIYEDKRMERLVEYSGYPNANALYQICHQHVDDFFKGK